MHEELIDRLGDCHRKLANIAEAYGMEKLLYKTRATINDTIAALSQPSGNSGQLAVDDAMVTRAINASLAHWEASIQKCNRCDGTGKTACGDSQDYCDCGGGYVSDATEESAMRAALQAVLIQPTPAAASSRYAMDAIIAAYKTWPDDLRKKLSMHDLRRMTGWRQPMQKPSDSPSGWLPIDEAPKDGTWVALYSSDEKVQAGYWGPTYFSYDYAWIQYSHRSAYELVRGKPTHYQPLPAPPEPSP